MGIWVIAAWLVLLFSSDRAAYDAQIAAGAKVQNCVTWDSNGHAQPGECAEPAPSLNLGGGR